MPRFDVARGAAVAGIALIAVSVLDLLVAGGAPGVMHAAVAGFGFALVAVAEAADAGR